MARPKPDSDYCADCEHLSEKMTKCVPNGCQKNLEIEICEGCDGGVLWERLEDEDVLMESEHEEFWGAPCSYSVAVGYRCPLCGEINHF